MRQPGSGQQARANEGIELVSLIPSMILGPLAAGIGLLWLKPDYLRRVLVIGATLGVCAASLALTHLPAPSALAFKHHAVNGLMLVAEVAMALYFVRVAYVARRPLIAVLAVAQGALMLWFETNPQLQLEAEQPLYLDQFSVLMALVNGVLGGGIALYALGYMRDYHEVHHPEVADRRPLFFALIFVFMGAMFGIIFANNLLWYYFFWEITTLCSFLLIGYSGKPEAINNSLHALTLNLLGGLAFALAIVTFHGIAGKIELRELSDALPATVGLPVALLCLAGLTKSAQLPFSTWLLGAMVAPTPVSALLHSSTMVKAGVYLVLRLAPVLCGTVTGVVVALVGAVTFVVGSFAAISAQDAKRVLAHSTVANLGLIILCAGIGTAEAVWAALLLILFHAVAKCLLFLCVGVVEHKLGSRNIESMSGLILHLPRVAVMMLIGMAGMFLAPFGMLISKWAVLKAVVDAYPILCGFIVFGSSATLFFWVKWMGKLLETVSPRAPISQHLHLGESFTLYGLAACTFLTCLFFPFVSSRFVEPYVERVLGQSVTMSPGNIIIMTIMMLVVMLFPVSFLNYGRGVKVMDAYLGGANLHGSLRFRGSIGAPQDVQLDNYYLRPLFPEPLLLRWGTLATTVILAALLLAVLL